MAESSSTRSYSSDPTLWLYTSLSSGSSQIVTATSRLETILKANRIPFKALDVATDEKARMLWGRRAGKRKLPGLVKMGMVIGDIDEIEEWNEYGELKEQLGAEVTQSPAPPISSTTKEQTKTSTAAATAPAAPPVPTAQESLAAASKASADTPPAPKPVSSISFAPEKSKSDTLQAGAGGAQASMSMAMRQLGQEAAARANKNKSDSLAARKAQLAASEKTDSTGSTATPEPAGATDGVSAPTSSIADTDIVSKHESVPVVEEAKDSNAISSKDTGDNADTAIISTTTKEADPASGASAARPESPLPVPGEEPATKPDLNAPIIPSLQKSESAVSSTSIPVSIENLNKPEYIIGTHRGSSISAASKEEIQEVEEALKIPEEPEHEEADHAAAKPTTESASKQTDKTADQDQHVQFAGERKGEEIDRVKEELERDTSSTREPESILEDPSNTEQTKASNTKGSTAEQPTTSHEAPKTQQQPAADPAMATESVED